MSDTGVKKVASAVRGVAKAPAQLTIGFLGGLKYPFRGARFVYLQHPGLVKFWIFPLLITTVLLGVVFWQIGAHHAELVNALWEAPTEEGAWASVQRFVHTVLDWLLTALMMIVGLLVVAASASILAAPFNDALSEEVERRVTGAPGPAFSLGRLLADTWRTIRIEVGKLLLLASIMIPLFIAQFLIPGVGAVLYSIAGFVFTATYFALDYVDWPASRRGRGLRYRLGMIRGRFSTMFGFGTGVYLFLFIPIVNLLFMPAAVAGGTLLFLDLEGETPGLLPDSNADGVTPDANLDGTL